MKYTLFFAVIAQLAIASPQITTSHWLGEIKITSPSGRKHGTAFSLMKRTLDPAVKVIVEEVLHVSAGEAKPYLTIYKVENDQKGFTVRDADGAFSGKGTLTGKPWQWTSWKTAGTMKDGTGSFRSNHHFAKGQIIVRKEFLDAKGKAKVIFSEELRHISPELYDLLHAKLSRAKSPLG